MGKPETILQLVNEANSLISRGEYQAARNAIKSSPHYAELSDDSAPLYLAEMNSLLAQGDLKEAMSVVRRLDRPDLGVLVNIYRLYYVAQIQQALGEMDEALETIEAAERIAHQNESEVDGDVLCMITARRDTFFLILSDGLMHF